MLIHGSPVVTAPAPILQIDVFSFLKCSLTPPAHWIGHSCCGFTSWGTLSTPRDQIPPTEAVSRAQPMPTECVTTESQPSSATCTPTTWANDPLLLAFPRPCPRHTHTGCGEALLGSRKRSGSILLPGGEESLLASAFKTSPMICDFSAQAGLGPGLPVILDTEPTTQLILSCADAPGAVTGEHTTGVNLVSYAADR